MEHWDIIVNCLSDPKKWQPIPLPLNKDLRIGSGLERALDGAGRELAKMSKSKAAVTFWVRGNVLIVKESAGLKLLPQGNILDYQVKAQVEGALEKCFTVLGVTGEFEWTECRDS
jgi:hypothetical protein